MSSIRERDADMRRMAREDAQSGAPSAYPAHPVYAQEYAENEKKESASA